MQKIALGAFYIALFAIPFSVSAVTFTVDGSSMFKGSPFSTVTVHSSEATSSALFDFELYDLNGNKAAQRFTTFDTKDGQTDCTWDITAGYGPYILKYGVFSTDWSTVYAWEDNWGVVADTSVGSNTISCGNPSEVAPTFKTSASVPKNTEVGGASAFHTTVESTQDISNVLVDTELYDASNTRIGQWFTLKNLSAYTPVTIDNSLELPPVGIYHLRVGIFSSDWSKMYDWNENAGTFTTWSNATPPLSPVAPPLVPPVDSSVIYYTIDGVQTLKDIVTTNLSNALYDIEVYDALGNKVFQGSTPYSNTVFPMPGNPLKDGTYTFKVGVFSPDWSQLYDWNDNAGTATIDQLSDVQIQSLLNLLQYFGADPQTIYSTERVLHGQNPYLLDGTLSQPPLPQAEAQAIVNLLTSFGASPTTITNLEKVLSGLYLA